jgi:hypothetical protein
VPLMNSSTRPTPDACRLNAKTTCAMPDTSRYAPNTITMTSKVRGKTGRGMPRITVTTPETSMNFHRWTDGVTSAMRSEGSIDFWGRHWSWSLARTLPAVSVPDAGDDGAVVGVSSLSDDLGFGGGQLGSISSIADAGDNNTAIGAGIRSVVTAGGGGSNFASATGIDQVVKAIGASNSATAVGIRQTVTAGGAQSSDNQAFAYGRDQVVTAGNLSGGSTPNTYNRAIALGRYSNASAGDGNFNRAAALGRNSTAQAGPGDYKRVVAGPRTTAQSAASTLSKRASATLLGLPGRGYRARSLAAEWLHNRLGEGLQVAIGGARAGIARKSRRSLDGVVVRRIEDDEVAQAGLITMAL